MLKKNYFSISSFFGIFLAKKQSKLIKNEENRPNSNRLIKFPEIWFVDVFQQEKMLQKSCFSILAFFAFLVKKQPKLTKNEENWQNPNRLMNILKFGM